LRRDLNRLANEEHDLLVIGGGIMGAAIARDAALRGLSVALVERSDFAGATSAHNSKLIHGGLRYLRNFELGLVRESLRERRIWLDTAPHLVRPLPFLLPVTETGTRIAYAAGLALYDALSRKSGRNNGPDRRLPAHEWLDAHDAEALEPCLAELPLRGAFRYFDAQMLSPERLALACVVDAADNGAALANHVEAEALLLRGDDIAGARVRDRFGGSVFDIRARLTVTALGAWTDLFLGRALPRAATPLLRSRGIHVLVPRFVRTHALTIATKSGGHFFAIPWRDSTLLGTTDTPFDGDSDCVGVGRSEIEDFLQLVNAHLPAVQLVPADVKHAYAGLRALVDAGARSSYKASRRAGLIDFGKSARLNGLMAVIGGKWTTARSVAETTLDLALRKLHRHARACTTATRRLPESGGGDVEMQIARATREEMAVTLEDVIMRRTAIGQEGDPGPAVLEQAATIMARECGWSDAHKRAEIAAVAALYAAHDRR
jgi:glycerol-3-phosphate dehydrogenase